MPSTKDKPDFSPALYAGVIPPLMVFYLSYFGMDMLKYLFKHIPLVKGGTINRNFLYESIFLNSAASYIGVITGVVAAILSTKILNPVDLTVKKFFKAFATGSIIFILMFYFIAFPDQHNLAVSAPPFRKLAKFYFTTSLLYSVMYSGAYYFMALFAAIATISLPAKIILDKLK